MEGRGKKAYDWKYAQAVSRLMSQMLITDATARRGGSLVPVSDVTLLRKV